MLSALRFAKDCVDMKNDSFNMVFQEICLPEYAKIANFRKDDQSEDRGKFYFNDNPDKTQSSYGNSALRLVLESI